jgi:2-hydroxychromene-2-carboxylate isomerase
VNSLTLYIDFKSGPAYLAMQPTLALLKRHGVAADWRPFDTRQYELKRERPGETRTETHFRIREQQRRQACLQYAAIQGVPMVYPETPGSTGCALAALLYVADAPLPFISRAFRAYWSEGQDLDKPEVVAALLSDSGYDAEGFAPEVWCNSLPATQREAEDRGVFDTPMFIIGEELFLGREQLPWIESLLSV